MGSDDRHDLAIRRLQRLGGPRGQVTLDQVKSALPIDEMTPEEIGRAVARLEEAGVEVSLEEDLLRPRPGSGDDGNVPPGDPAPGVPDPGRAPAVPPAVLPVPTALGAGAPGAGRDGPGPWRAAAPLALAAVLVLAALVAGAVLLRVLGS